MNDYLAIALVGGIETPSDGQQFYDAWQYLHDTGLAYELRDWHSEHALRLLDEGILQ